MKIEKEVWLVIAIIGLIVAWLIDKIAGPISISVSDPISFLQSPLLLNKYPLTTTAVAIRSVSVAILIVAAMALLIEKKYFTKAFSLFILGVLGEFYAIQQLATGFQLTSIQWTLSIAYGSLCLVFGIIAMILMGIWSMFNKKTPNEPLKEQSS